MLSSLLVATVAISVARNNIERQNSEFLQRRTQELIEENRVLQAQQLRRLADETENEKVAVLNDAQHHADLMKQKAEDEKLSLLSNAERESKLLKHKAENEKLALLADARHEANQLKQKASEQVRRMISEAEANINAMKQQAQDEILKKQIDDQSQQATISFLTAIISILCIALAFSCTRNR